MRGAPTGLVVRPHWFLVVALLSVMAQPGAAQRNPDVRINTNPPGTAQAHGVQVAASGSAVYVVWEDRRHRSLGGDIYFNASTNGGGTWMTADVRISSFPAGTATASRPQIAAIGPNVFVTWSDNRNGRTASVYFNASRDGGLTWLAADVRLNTSAAFARSSWLSQIAAVGSNVYVTWMDNRNGGEDIYFNRSTDGGATWLSSDRRLDTDPPGAADSKAPQIAAVDSNVYVVWQDERDFSFGRADIYFNRSTDGGATWSIEDEKLNRAGKTAVAPQIAAEGAGVHVTWEDRRDGSEDIYFNTSANHGATWLGADVRLDTDPPGSASSRLPVIAAASPNVYVAWSEHRDGFWEAVYLNYSHDNGATWQSSDVRIDTSPLPPGIPGYSQYPDIAAHGTSVYVAWEDGRGGPGAATYFNRSTDRGASWLQQDRRLKTAVVGYAWPPRIAATAAGVFVVWEDRRVSSLEDIYFNIPFGWIPYGSGTAASGGGIPKLAGSGQATIGNTVSVDITGAPAGTAAFMLVGDGPTSKISLSTLGVEVLVAPLVALVFPLSGSGSGQLPVVIPALPVFVGTNINFQALVLDFSGSSGLSATNGLELWIG